MASWRNKGKGDETPTDPAAMETPAGEARPAAEGEPASVEGGRATGTPVYPPPASDQSGERTANVPPARQLPTKAPASENAAARKPPPSLSQAIDARDKYVAELEAECADLRQKLGLPPRGQEAEEDTGPKRKATVTFPNSHVGSVDVEYPADTAEKERDAAARAAAARKLGIWQMPGDTVVAHANGG